MTDTYHRKSALVAGLRTYRLPLTDNTMLIIRLDFDGTYYLQIATPVEGMYWVSNAHPINTRPTIVDLTRTIGIGLEEVHATLASHELTSDHNVAAEELDKIADAPLLVTAVNAAAGILGRRSEIGVSAIKRGIQDGRSRVSISNMSWRFVVMS